MEEKIKEIIENFIEADKSMYNEMEDSLKEIEESNGIVIVERDEDYITGEMTHIESVDVEGEEELIEVITNFTYNWGEEVNIDDIQNSELFDEEYLKEKINEQLNIFIQDYQEAVDNYISNIIEFFYERDIDADISDNIVILDTEEGQIFFPLFDKDRRIDDFQKFND